MYQPKRNIITTKYMLQTKSPRRDKKCVKIKQIKSKIFRNLNQFPIELHHDAKENINHNPPFRHTASFHHDQSHMHKALKAIRAQSALSQYHDHRDNHNHNRKRLSLDSTGKRYQRDSLASKNSFSKKMSKNQKNIEQPIKIKICQQRKKSNISCASINQEQKTTKKHSIKQKRPSTSNLQLQQKYKGKQNRSPNKKIEKDKSRSKSNKNKRKKSTYQLQKSKGSTTAINTHQKNIKKKQSTSTVQIHQNGQKKKKKNVKKKSLKNQGNNNDQYSVQEYPINKYDTAYNTTPHQFYVNNANHKSTKTRSRSRKGSSSKQPKRSLLQLDYVSCINIPSNSSGLINSAHSRESKAQNEKIKIIDNWQYRYFQQKTQSFDLEQIKYFQRYNNSKKKQEKQFMDKNFNRSRQYQLRKLIEDQIIGEYPQFGELEIKFLASVIFIQRKWREYLLYKEVFSNFTKFQNKGYSFQQSNSKQLNISVKDKSSEKKGREVKKEVEQERKDFCSEEKRQLFVEKQKENESKSQQKQIFKEKSQQRQKSKQSQQSQQRQNVQQIQKQQEKPQQKQKQRLRNNIYLHYKQIQDDDQQLQSPQSTRMKEQQPNKYYIKHLQHPQQIYQQKTQQKSISQKPYQFLQNQQFPIPTYLNLKEIQLKQKYYNNIKQLDQLYHKDIISYKEYQKLKLQAQMELQMQIHLLNKSKKDIRKGFLKYIQTCREIKSERGLRRVSSENGPMAKLYWKVYHLEKTGKNSSESSESVKRLTRKVLIRKQFFQTQKIQANVFNNQTVKTQSARQKNQKKESYSLSARLAKRHQGDKVQQQQQLAINRIRQGLVISPQIYQISPHNPHNSPQPHITQQQYRKETLILQQIISTLSNQLFTQLILIDESREQSSQIITYQQKGSISKIKPQQIQDFQIMQETDSIELQIQQPRQKDKEQDFQIVQEFKFRQIFKIQGLGDRGEVNVNRKHRNSPHIHHISPASDQLINFQAQEILMYAKQLFQFFKKIGILEEITHKLNKNQGFTPQQYLKFLRDFQIPDEEYDPLISNQIFIHWQDTYYKDKKIPQDNQIYSKRQAITIFHRCIFQCLIGLLQQKRPSGDKGEPFPWQNILYFKHQITPQTLPFLFKTCISQLQKIINSKCGLIQQKQLIINQQDMQRFHQQNEDRIINMLQGQLSKTNDQWYQIQEHGLQIKLEIQIQVYQYILLQALDQLLSIL